MRFFGKTLVLALVGLLATAATAQTCNTRHDMDPGVKAALERAALNYWNLSAQGNTAALQQAAIPEIQGNFAGIAKSAQDYAARFRSAQPHVRDVFLLTAEGAAPLPEARFYCGIANSRRFVEFVIPNLPPGRYAVAVVDGRAPEGLNVLSVVMREDMGQWKLAGYYPKPGNIKGHDLSYYLQKAREFRAAGQNHNAWFYYLTVRYMAAPVDFVATSAIQDLDTEAQKVRPNDLPGEQPLNFSADGKTFPITSIEPVPTGDQFHLVLRYNWPDISNTGQIHVQNLNLIRAFIARYPEYKNAFDGVVARAVAPNGQDYGSLMSMQELGAGTSASR
jgi:hypothetical protein